MLRDWVETETWNTLGTGIQANDIEAVSTADATTAEVAAGKLVIDVTASLMAWANNPSANFGWAILPTAPNGVMLDSSEGATPPKLTVTFATASANNPPAVALANTVTTLSENTDTSVRIKVADIVITDDGAGTNVLSLGGTDAGLFEIDGAELYLKAGVVLDYETNPALDVAVLVDDSTVGATPDSTAALTIAIADINEPPIVTLANMVTTLAENADTSVRTKIADIVVTDDASGVNALSLGGTNAGLFEIDGTGLYLKAGVLLDPDTQPVLDVAVLVDDSAVGSAPDSTAALAISITDVNEPPVVTLTNVITTLAENVGTSVPIKVADITVADDGSGTNNLVLSGADAALFEIDGTELYLKSGVVLDYETNPILDVTVAVDDPTVGGNPDSTAALAIAITDVNEPPTVALANVTTTLAENTDTGARIHIADIVVTDDAPGTNLLSLAGSDAASFEIEGTILYLKAGAGLNAETNPVLDVIVAVDDAAVGSTPDAMAALAVAVSNVNNPPTVTLENMLAILAENTDTSVRTKVADIAVTDDASGPNVLSLGGADAALFEIEGTELYLKAGVALDYEANPILDVTVLVDDPAVGTTPDSTAALAIAITDVNEPPAVTLVNATTTLAENANTSVRTKVADITVTDDASGTNVLSLGGTDAALFEIEGTELYLKAGVALDYQANPILDVTVLVDDPAVGTTPDSTAALAIDITPVVEIQTVTFQQNINGYTGTLDTDIRGDAPDRQYSTAKSVRVDGRNITYPVHGLLEFGDLFGSGSSQIPVGAQILSAQLEVTVADGGQSLTFHRMLRDWMETETWNTLVGGVQADDIEAVSTADANTGSIAIGTLVVDVTPSLLAWANDPSINFGWAILPTGTDSVVFGSSEFSAAPKLTVVFTTASGNVPPTVDLANQVTTLAENIDTSTRIKVADIVVTDDGIGTNTLGLGGTDAGLFEIDGAGLYLKAGVSLDYETHPALDVAVLVDDPTVGATPDDAAALAIAITDINEPPTVALANTVTTLAENTDTSVRTKVADIVVTDDASGTNTLSLGGTDAAFFEIDGTELHLKAGASLDHESNPVLDVAVLVDDSAVGVAPDSTAALAIAITDVNGPPAVTLANTVTALAENVDTSVRIRVADIAVIDDASGTNVLSLGGTDAALFEIEGTELYLKAGAALDYETHPSLNVTVAVDDSAVGTSPDGTAALTISITDAPEVTTYYVSQLGTGDGTTESAPASVASFNAGVGPFGALDGATIYFLGTITTTIAPADSGTADSRIVLRGDYPGQPCTIDGAGTLAVGIDITNNDYISVVGFTIQNTTTSAIRVASEAVGTIIEGCTIIQTAGRSITFQSPITMTGNTLTATGGTESLYSQLGTSGGTVTITGNTLNFNHTSSGLYIRGYGDHIITSNDINLSAGSARVLNASGTGSEVGSIQFSGNDIDSSVAPGDSLVSLVAGNWIATISDNTFDLTASAFSHEVIYLSSLAAPVISGNTINVADDVACVYLSGNGRGAVATITHNVLTHTGGAGEQYIIRVGEESANSYQYAYDGVIITDNRVTGFNAIGNCHAVFVGFNRNAVIARNYISNAGYGVVVKGTEGTDYTAGGILHNVIYNCDIGIRIKGVDDVVVVNNTVYSPHALIVTGNVGGDESTGVVLKNNILCGTGGCLLQIGSSTDLSTLAASDYATNCLYVYSSGSYVKYQGINYTYAAWVALGYDNGSINTDPLLANPMTGDFTLLAGSPCIDAGTNLGDLYDDALAPSSTWPFVATLDQDDYGTAWELGAYLVS